MEFCERTVFSKHFLIEPEAKSQENESEIVNGSIPTNDTPLEVLQSTDDSAMKALSVTYQTLSLTALAKQHSNSFSDSDTPGSESVFVNHTDIEKNDSEKTNGFSEKKGTKNATDCEIVISDERTSTNKAQTNALHEADSEKSSIGNVSSLISFDSGMH